MTRNIDELNNLTTRAVEPERYFGEMDLTEEQVDKRLKYTKKANELFDVILILLLTMRDNGTLDYLYARDMLESWILSLINEFTTPDDYLIDYATDTAYNFVDTTKKHIDEAWYTSSDRALYNAENSANDVLNYTEYIEALRSGKTHKKWITEPDNRVRKTHREVTKKPIPISELFNVGFALMRFPKDYELAEAFPEELVNCRCSIEYLPKERTETEEASRGLKGEYEKGIVDNKTNSHKALKQRISQLGEDAETNVEILNNAFDMLYHRSGTHYEDLAYVDTVNKKSLINKDFDYFDEKTQTSACKPSDEMEKKREELPDYTVIGLHNHPASSVPSVNDFIKCRERKYKYGLVFPHKTGILYQYYVDDNPLFNEVSYLTVDNILADLQTALYNNKKELEIEALKKLLDYGIDLRIIK